MLPEPWLTRTILAIPAFPAACFLLLGGAMMLSHVPSERNIRKLVGSSFALSLLAAVLVGVHLFVSGQPAHPFSLGTWFHLGPYDFELTFLIDSLSLAFIFLTTIISGLIGRFSYTYMHREPGFARFFLLLTMFATGMLILVMSGNIDFLFVGWELMGLTSALLIAFFWERKEPVKNALRAFITYRVCDLGILMGAVLLHHHAHTSEFVSPLEPVHWPLGTFHLTSSQATVVALLFLVGAIGKSAQLPAAGWLPRAMEGPTPSSALFYGALSVHAGCYLLLRLAPLLDRSYVASSVIVVVGIVTALYATIVGRVQSDAKNELAFATMTQVGLIFTEIGFGWYRLAVIHILGHACVRTFQMLRAPNVLHDFHDLFAAAGSTQLTTGAHYEKLLSGRLRSRIYALALERFYLDEFLDRYVASPVLNLARLIHRGEEKWIGILGGGRIVRGDRARRNSAPPGFTRTPATAGTPHPKDRNRENTNMDGKQL